MATMYDAAATRGQFFQPCTTLQAPIHLDGRVHQYLAEKAQRKGVSVEDLVNDLLKKTIELSWRLDG